MDAARFLKRFEPGLEARFQNELMPEKIALARWGAGLVLVLSIVFLVFEFLALPYVFAVTLPIRGVVIVATVAIGLASTRPWLLRHYDVILGGFALLVGLGLETITIALDPNQPAREIYSLGIVLVVVGIFGLTFLRPSMGHGITAAFLLAHGVILYITEEDIGARELTLFTAYALAYAGVWMISATAQASREQHARRSFLRKCELESALFLEERARVSSDELARGDALTGLANRRHFEATLDEKTREARATGSMVAVLFLDLDRFKEINDQYGHVIGDGVLRSVAQRIRGALSENDCVSRYGGDEFVIASPRASQHLAARISERLCALFAEPFVEGDVRAQLGASVGWALFPRDGETAAQLIAEADRQMYQVKLGRRAAAGLQ